MNGSDIASSILSVAIFAIPSAFVTKVITVSNFFTVIYLYVLLQRLPSQLSSFFHSSSRQQMAEIYYSDPIVEMEKTAPDFEAPAVVFEDIKKISLTDYRGSWTVLLFYPKDFTFVCPTEIIAFSDRNVEFEKLGAKVLAISTDTEEVHLAWWVATCC